MLINSFKNRQDRINLKRNRILGFLRDEIWSNTSNLAAVVDMTESATLRTLKMMERDQFVAKHYLPDFRVNVWGITPHGLGFAWGDGEEMAARPHFEPSKLVATTVQHHLDVQRARLSAESAGWTSWMPGSRLPKNIKKRPDAIANDLAGGAVAIELERTIKTRKRYESIFAIYLQSIAKKEFDRVHYVCPSPEFAKRLQQMFDSISSVQVAGERVKLQDKHRDRLPIFSLQNWPPNSSDESL